MRKRIGVSNTWNWKLAESTVLSLRSVSESLHPSQEDGLFWHPLLSSLSCAFVPLLILHTLTPCTEQRWRHHRSFQTLGLILLKGGLCLSEWLVSRKAIQEYDFSTPNFIHSHEQLHTGIRELKEPKMLHRIQIKSCLWAEKNLQDKNLQWRAAWGDPELFHSAGAEDAQDFPWILSSQKDWAWIHLINHPCSTDVS